MSQARGLPMQLGGQVPRDSSVAVYLARTTELISERIAQADIAGEDVDCHVEALVAIWRARWELNLTPGAGLLSTESDEQDSEDDDGATGEAEVKATHTEGRSE
jgi:hypothetical protein